MWDLVAEELLLLRFDHGGHGLIIFFLHPEHPIPMKTLPNKEIEYKSNDRKEKKGHQPCSRRSGALPLNKDDGECKENVDEIDNRYNEVVCKFDEIGKDDYHP